MNFHGPELGVHKISLPNTETPGRGNKISRFAHKKLFFLFSIIMQLMMIKDFNSLFHVSMFSCLFWQCTVQCFTQNTKNIEFVTLKVNIAFPAPHNIESFRTFSFFSWKDFFYIRLVCTEVSWLKHVTSVKKSTQRH